MPKLTGLTSQTRYTLQTASVTRSSTSTPTDILVALCANMDEYLTAPIARVMWRRKLQRNRSVLTRNIKGRWSDCFQRWR